MRDPMTPKTTAWMQRTLAAFFAVSCGALALGAAACNDFTPGKCPPADPPAIAKYLDDSTISIDVSTSDDTGDLSFGQAKNFQGGDLSFQESGQSLHLRITVKPDAKAISADVPVTCNGGVSGTFKVVAQVPVTHKTGDQLPVTTTAY